MKFKPFKPKPGDRMEPIISDLFHRVLALTEAHNRLKALVLRQQVRISLLAQGPTLEGARGRTEAVTSWVWDDEAHTRGHAVVTLIPTEKQRQNDWPSEPEKKPLTKARKRKRTHANKPKKS